MWQWGESRGPEGGASKPSVLTQDPLALGSSGFWACSSASGEGVCPWPSYSKKNKGRLSCKTGIPCQPHEPQGSLNALRPHPCTPRSTQQLAALVKRLSCPGFKSHPASISPLASGLNNAHSSLFEVPQELHKWSASLAHLP